MKLILLLVGSVLLLATAGCEREHWTHHSHGGAYDNYNSGYSHGSDSGWSHGHRDRDWDDR